MWYPFFIVGGFWFWTLLVLTFIILVICVEFEAPFKALGTIVMTSTLLILFGNLSPFAWMAAHPLQVVGSLVGYLGIGVAWSIAKWWLFVSKRLEEYDEIKAQWLEARDVTSYVVPPELRKDWAVYAKQDYFLKRLKDPPQARLHKSKIVTWMVYWPSSLFWSTFDDLIRKIFTGIYLKLVDKLQQISNRVFLSVEEDFADH